MSNNIRSQLAESKRRRKLIKKRKKKIRKRISKKSPFQRIMKKAAIFLGICGLGALGVFIVNLFKSESKVTILIHVASYEMLQEEALPAFMVEVETPNKVSQKINRRKNYTVGDLLKTLRAGKGYQLICESDGLSEGEFPIILRFDENLQEKLDGEWIEKVEINIKEGMLTVKNKFGQHEGTRFKRYDGTYVMDSFIDSMGDTYYFDSNGEMVTGELKINYTLFTFDENGKLVSEMDFLNPDKPMVALTYDDGPGDRTNELLDILEEYHAHATFFMQGKQIYGRNTDVLQRMVEIGCETANHTFSHPDLTKISIGTMHNQIGDTNARIVEATGGTEAKLLRPPYGATNDTVKANAGMPLVLWSIDTLDWKTKDAQKTIDHIMKEVQDGDIILMHDIHDSTIEAAKELIPKLQEEGYQLVTVSEMAELRGITLEPGVRYFNFRK